MKIKVPTQRLQRRLMFDLDFMFNSSLWKKTELISATVFVSHKFCAARRFSNICKT